MKNSANGTNTARVITSWRIFNCGQCQCRVTDAIGRHLQKILNKRDAQGSRAAIHPGAGLSCFRWP